MILVPVVMKHQITKKFNLHRFEIPVHVVPELDMQDLLEGYIINLSGVMIVLVNLRMGIPNVTYCFIDSGVSF